MEMWLLSSSMGFSQPFSTSRSLPNFDVNSTVGGDNQLGNGGGGWARLKKFSSRSIGFFSNNTSPGFGVSRSIYRGRSAPLTCKVTSSLAAVMAQMLSHRATHVWVIVLRIWKWWCFSWGVGLCRHFGCSDQTACCAYSFQSIIWGIWQWNSNLNSWFSIIIIIIIIIS